MTCTQRERFRVLQCNSLLLSNLSVLLNFINQLQANRAIELLARPTSVLLQQLTLMLHRKRWVCQVLLNIENMIHSDASSSSKVYLQEAGACL